MVTKRNEYAVDPGIGAGELRFGMSRQDVYGILGNPSWRREPNEFTPMTSEQFSPRCCFVDFDPRGRCCAIEFYPDARVTLEGRNIMAMTYDDLVIHLRSKGVSFKERGDGLRADELGIACWAPQISDPDCSHAPVESLVVYERGYYESDAPTAG